MNVVGEFFLVILIHNCKYLTFKIVGPVKCLEDQQILGVTGPTGPVTV